MSKIKPQSCVIESSSHHKEIGKLYYQGVEYNGLLLTWNTGSAIVQEKYQNLLCRAQICISIFCLCFSSTEMERWMMWWFLSGGLGWKRVQLSRSSPWSGRPGHARLSLPGTGPGADAGVQLQRHLHFFAGGNSLPLEIRLLSAWRTRSIRN